MNKTVIIAYWEIMQRLKRKSFWFATIFIPLFVFSVSSLPLMNNNSKNNVKQINIGFLDSSRTLSKFVKILVSDFNNKKEGKINLMDFSTLPSSVSFQLDSLFNASAIDVEVTVNRNLKEIKLKYRNPETLWIVKSFESIVKHAARVNLILNADIPVKLKSKLLREPEIKEQKSGEKNISFILKEKFSSVFALSLIFISIILFSGGMLIHGFAEEKSTKIIELLLTSAPEDSILIGKSLGMFLLNLFQILIWALLALIFFNNRIPGFSLVQIFIFTILFLLGYFTFTTLFVAIGAFARTDQDAQQILAIISFIVILPLLSLISLWSTPNGFWEKVLLYFPLTSVQTFFLNFGLNNYSLSQFFIVITVNLFSIGILLFFVKKYFRKGIVESN